MPTTHGDRLSRRRIGEFVLTDATYGAGLSVPSHDHEFPSWTFVLAGSFEERFAHGPERCMAGDVLSKVGSATHANRYGPHGARCLLVELTGPRLTTMGIGRSLFTRVIHAPDVIAGSLGQRLYREFLCADAIGDLAAEAVLLETAVLLTRRSDSGPVHRRWLWNAKQRLEADFRDPPGIEVLAEAANVHPGHYCRAFRGAFGCSPHEYARRVRLEWTQRALVDSTMSLSEVAIAAGFSDQSHLTREFRRRTGMTPSRFRDAMR